jgi:uncharacterized membrane protein YkvA (DUF1232 family)
MRLGRRGVSPRAGLFLYNRPMSGGAKDWAKRIKRDVVALYLCARDPRTPWYAKALALAIAGYALSPIDLIPDFIPVLGYLDDVIIVPLGILAVRALIPADVLAENRLRAEQLAERPVNRTAALVIIAIWVIAAVAVAFYFFRGAT